MRNVKKLLSPTRVVALQKIIQATAGLVTALMVAHFLNSEEQGYYYTIGSLLSSYIIFDLGLSSYLLQKSAQITNQPDKKSNFIGFAHWTFKWYRNAGTIAFVTLAPIGIYILGQNQSETAHIDWLGPWLFTVFAVALSMPTIGFFALLEGSGAILETYYLRSAHYFIGALLAWFFIASGHGLYAQALPLVATLLVSYSWYTYKYKGIFKQKTLNCNIKSEIKPFVQIKYTSSNWLGNYIFLNFPIILSFLAGEIVSSGQLGLSIIIANVGGAIALSRFTAQVPEIIKNLHSENRIVAIKKLLSSLKIAGVTYGIGSISILAITYLFDNVNFFTRLLPTFDLFFLLTALGGLHLSNALVIYLRACNQDSLSLAMLFFGILTIPLDFLLESLGVLGIIVSTCICSLLLSAFGVFKLLTTKRPS